MNGRKLNFEFRKQWQTAGDWMEVADMNQVHFFLKLPVVYLIENYVRATGDTSIKSICICYSNYAAITWP